MRDKQVLLSVIITVYNLEEYIGPCLESIVSQQPKDTEIIVVDDGSKDESISIIKTYVDRYPNLIKAEFLEAPGSMGRAHKRGYDLARGEYCQFIDGDDWLEPDAFQRIFDAISKNNPDVIMAKSKMVMDEGSVAFKDANIEPEFINGRAKEQVIKYITELPNFHMFFWRYVFKKANVPDLLEYAINKKLFLNDWLPAAKILLSGTSFVCLEQPFYDYRQRQSSSVSKALKNSYPEACFFTFFEFINLMNIREWQPWEKDFIRSRLELIWEMAIDLSDVLNDEAFEEVVLELSRFEKDLMSLEANSEILKLQKSISEKGILEGLKAIIALRREQCIQAYKNNKGKEIFIFPTGQKAEYATRVLKNEKLSVQGFFDNDKNKDGVFFEGVECRHPSQMIDEEKGKTGFVIATIWPKAQEAICSQLIELGIKEENITKF